MNEVKELGNNELPKVDGIEITPLNQVDPVNDGGDEGGYATLTIVLTICA
jgi:hypothetical protein